MMGAVPLACAEAFRQLVRVWISDSGMCWSFLLASESMNGWQIQVHSVTYESQWVLWYWEDIPSLNMANAQQFWFHESHEWFPNLAGRKVNCILAFQLTHLVHKEPIGNWCPAWLAISLLWLMGINKEIFGF